MTCEALLFTLQHTGINCGIEIRYTKLTIIPVFLGDCVVTYDGRLCVNVVVKFPDLLLMFSLFVTDKGFACYVLDIASVFAGKLVVDS